MTTATVTEPLTPVDAPAELEDGAAISADDLVLADLLVEEISIDGMCGVY